MMAIDREYYSSLFPQSSDEGCDAFVDLAFAAMDVIDVLSDKINDTEKCFDRLSEEYSDLQSEKINLQRAVDEYRMKLDTLQKENAALKSAPLASDAAKAEAEKLTMENALLKSKIKSLNQEHEKLSELNLKLKKSLEALTDQNDEGAKQ